jgi:hypothetical protein
MKFITQSKNKNIIKACELATSVLHNDLFWDSLENIQFDFSNDGNGGKVSTEQLKNLLQNHVTQVEVKTKFFYPWSKVVGVYFGGKEFFTNPKMCPTPHHFVGNFLHELCHVVDNFVPEYIGHLNNNPKGKENSAPYWIGRKAKEWSQSGK